MLSIIPLPYRVIAGLALFSLWSGFMFYGGWHECSVREQAKQLKDALAYAEAIKKEIARGDQIAADLEAEKQRQKVVYRTITREVPYYVSSISDSRCVVPVGFRLLHDAAAKARQIETTSELVDAPSGIALSAVAETVADNYATCYEWRSQLNALIDWEEGKE